MTEAASWLFIVLQLFFVDLLLGVDNAVVIAIACQRLKPDDARRAVLFGAAGAIALRLFMVLFADALLGAPFVKLIAAWILIVVALNVRAGKDSASEGLGGIAGADLASAAAVIAILDATMSLDNVVALASIANGNSWALALGVLMSIPIIVYGALALTNAMRGAPDLLALGSAFLGWVAGSMAVSDPLLAGWVNEYAPALAIVAPPLAAAFVVIAGADLKPSAAAAPRRALREARLLAEVAIGDDRRPAVAEEKPGAADHPKVASVAAPAAELLLPERTAGNSARAVERTAPPPERRPASGAFGWSEEQLVIAGVVVLFCVAGLILAVASYLDDLM